MSRRALPPLVLREFQAEAVDRLSAALADAAEKIRLAPDRRAEIFRRIGSCQLTAPTASGKTVMLAATIARVEGVVWFWFAPFRGLVSQTIASLRAAAPVLRVRDPRLDRAAPGTRAGDVFVATWSAVAARNAESRRMLVDDDIAPALSTLLAAVREAGLLVGAVVDESHHTFRPNTQAFRFFVETLRPDLLAMATATPDDTDVERLRRELGIARFHHVSVSRDRVVEARLNKRAVRAITFEARGANAGLLDLNEVALRKAVEQHRATKALLAPHGVVPLLLVQAASAAWIPARVRELLTGSLGFAAGQVGVHTADEPDPDVQALAADPAVEVLVFKMAVGTGFDAPRASTLCALRPVADAGFGLQVIGRIMRVHPLLQSRDDLPATLDTGYVFLGDAEGQAGLQTAADRIRAIRDAITVLSDSVTVFRAQVEADGQIAVEDERGQCRLVLAMTGEIVAAPAFAEDAEPGPTPSPIADTLFGALVSVPSAPRLAAEPLPRSTASRSAPAHSYPRREGLPVPRCLRTEKMPSDTRLLLDTVLRHVAFTAEHRAMARQVRANVTRSESELFRRESIVRVHEQAEISDPLAHETARRLLRVSEFIDSAKLNAGLVEKLGTSLAEAGEEMPEAAVLSRAVNVILVRTPNLCRDALRRALAERAEVIDAAPLPATWDSPEAQPASALCLYGCLPAGLNTWEMAFADWLDSQPAHVLWWTRNPSRPRAHDDWSARIVLPESGGGFYPDFVVCVAGRKTTDQIALAETKERIETADSEAKSRTEHRVYGRALMLRYDVAADRFWRVEYEPARERNREVAMLRPDDLRL